MTNEPITVSIAQDLIPIHALSRLADDLIAALSHKSKVQLDLTGLSDADVRVVQLIEAARKHALEIGSSLTLAVPPGSILEQTLMRGGFLDAAEKSHCPQQDTCQ